MQAKTTKEFYPIERNGFLPGIIGIILMQEGNLVIANIQDAIVCDSHLLGVLPKVTDHMTGCGHGRFAMYHPGFVPCCIDDRLVLSQQRLFFKRSFEGFEKVTPEIDT